MFFDFQYDITSTPGIFLHFDFTTLLCKFALLIEKDGGIRPCEVLATCAYKVLRSTYPLQKWIGQISESQTIQPTFRHKLFSQFAVFSLRFAVLYCISFMRITAN
jgi:hypothetical protein